MELDMKQQVLMAIYMEYQKDIPEMSLVNAEKLKIGQVEFNAAIDKLQNEGYIDGAVIVKAGQAIPVKVFLIHTQMTKDGIRYVEEKLLGLDKKETTIRDNINISHVVGPVNINTILNNSKI